MLWCLRTNSAWVKLGCCYLGIASPLGGPVLVSHKVPKLDLFCKRSRHEAGSGKGLMWQVASLRSIGFCAICYCSKIRNLTINLMMRFILPRLETRTKEFIMCASI